MYSTTEQVRVPDQFEGDTEMTKHNTNPLEKKSLGAVNGMYPALTVLVGAEVDGKPNWITVANVGILTYKKPYYISIGLGKKQYTNMGIRENKSFSINIPSREMLIVTDYVGIVSGRQTDKSMLFESFYGELQNAPMIKECPVTMELKLHDVLELPEQDIFIGEVVQTFADACVLEGGKIHYGKVDPMLFDFQRIRYWSIGNEIGMPWNAGLAMKKVIDSK